MIFAIALNCEELLLLNTWKHNCPTNIQILNYFDYHSDADIKQYHQSGLTKFKKFVNMFLTTYGILIPSLLADDDIETYVSKNFDKGIKLFQILIPKTVDLLLKLKNLLIIKII